MPKQQPVTIPYPLGPRHWVGEMPHWISACEAVTWIGWGVAKDGTEIWEDEQAHYEKWGSEDFNAVLEAMKQAALHDTEDKEIFIDDSAYCKTKSSNFSENPPDPINIKLIRDKINDTSTKKLSYHDLISILESDINDENNKSKTFELASAELLNAMRGEQITGYGKRQYIEGKLNLDAEFIIIPLSFLLNYDIEICKLNWISLNVDKSYEKWRANWHNIFIESRFKLADILKLWPNESKYGDNFFAKTRSESFRLSELHLFAEYRARVARIQSEGKAVRPPSEADDQAWANRLFDKVPRAMLRRVRNKLAPESWRKSGRRAGDIRRE